MMGIRSDRRFLNLCCSWAPEEPWQEAILVEPGEGARISIGATSVYIKLLKQAEYMAATGFTLIRQTTFARGWVPYKGQVSIEPESGVMC